MPFRTLRRTLTIGFVLTLTFLLHPKANAFPATTQASVYPEGTIPQTALIQPAELNGLLVSGKKPTILQTGSHTLFTEAHIPGSQYTGAASTPEGLATLETRVAKMAKNAPIVLYCGCCPWGRCPNIRPAYTRLKGLGYTNVKVLYLAQDFGTDWVSKGFPVEREQ